MPLIDTTSLLKIADRAAAQYKFLYDAFTSLTPAGTNGFYWQIVTATNDPDVEIPTLQPYYAVDTGLNVDFTVKNGVQLGQIVSAMEAHFNILGPTGIPLQLGGWDGYLTTHNERVSYWFSKIFLDTTGNYMLANNVFSEGNDVFGTVTLAAGPTIVFTDGVNYGTGAITNPANGSNYAATQLKVVVVGMGMTNLDLRLSVKDINNVPATIDVTVPGGSLPGAEITIGATSDRFLDVMNVAFVPAGSTGTVGDSLTINNKKERQILL